MIIPLSDKCPGVEYVGSKAANLMVLNKYFLNVPHGWVISPATEKNGIKAFCSYLKGPYAIRSSCTLEDTEGLSFAGKYDTYINVEKDFYDHIDKVRNSVNNERAQLYMKRHGIETRPLMAVIVQEMVQPTVSGVTFTRHPDTGEFKCYISCVKGPCSQIVDGTCNPTEYIIGNDVNLTDTNVETVRENNVKLPKYAIRHIRDVCLTIESIYNLPMDIEWCFTRDPKNEYSEITILQARPITRINKKNEPILLGSGITNKIQVGTVKVMQTPDGGVLKPWEILVVPNTSPEWEPRMQECAGIITDHGCRTSHAALTAREMDLAAVIGTVDATTRLRTGQKVTLNCSKGEVYE